MRTVLLGALLFSSQPAEASCPDRDGDTYTDKRCGGGDCDDSDPATFPAADEDCIDELDNDCDGLTDKQDPDCLRCKDSDMDGHQDYACGGDDCDDELDWVHPGTRDPCGDGFDADCDGLDGPMGSCEHATVADQGCSSSAGPVAGAPLYFLAMMLASVRHDRKRD